MRAAQRALDGRPWLRPWAELAVLAHLTGWPTPVPGRPRSAAITALPARVRQCALSHAVDAAVAARAAAIADPAALAVHVGAAITARLERAEWLCQPDEPQWLLAGAVTEDVAFGAARPSAIEGAGPLPDLLAGLHRLPVAGAVPAGARGHDRGVTAGGVTLAAARPRARCAPGDGWSGLPPQRPVTHIQISAAAVRNRTVDVTQSPSMNCTCWNQGCAGRAPPPCR